MMNIDKEKLKTILPIAAVVIILAVSLILYMPLISRIKNKNTEYKKLKSELAITRSTIESTGGDYKKRIFLTEKELSQAIDELTRQGALKGGNLLSISPKEPVKVKGTQYDIVPIEIKVDSTYQQLGILMGSLDDLEKGLVEVRSFDIIRDKKDPSKFITDLVVGVYILSEK